MYNWKFLASDVDLTSLQWAYKNVVLNHWEKDILLIKAKKIQTSSSYFIFQGCIDIESDRVQNEVNDLGTFQKRPIIFSMCNPPFFVKIKDKVPRPSTVCTASASELATEGGETEFVKRMIDESLDIKDNIIWYTTLIGKKVNVRFILDYLKIKNVPMIEQGELKQGRNTRWVLGWTFHAPTIQTVRDFKRKLYRQDKIYNDRVYFISLSIGTSHRQVIEFISNWLNSKKISYSVDFSALECTGNIYSISPWYMSLECATVQTPHEECSLVGPAVIPDIIFHYQFKVMQSNRVQSSLVCTLEWRPSWSSSLAHSMHIFGILVKEIENFLMNEGLSPANQF
ncbi:U6 small nuclear RNA (adenine-(43)-N(6))-methyltransferase-like [Schistocerca gregaria]|uniref:U6 small nuclear RNA (adenine-(43)-N(6))-methyltransferase-like n=1 Tax=Schistocerca gregaria TaxID=7010 RepID=UPI00211EA640|nr:U6 small nuclear RNA (adenine-(43)-N(6))-methyltransferase-like [Schistocerca gregaria]